MEALRLVSVVLGGTRVGNTLTAAREMGACWVCGGGGSISRVKADKHEKSRREDLENCSYRFLLIASFIH